MTVEERSLDAGVGIGGEFATGVLMRDHQVVDELFGSAAESEQHQHQAG